MKQFNELSLAEPILRAVTAEGYTNPTPIQAGVIPAMMADKDIVGIAQTGTGKTASFVLPLLNRLSSEERGPAPKTCRALILAPTRELAAQIADSIRTYGQFMRHSVTVVVGGVKPGPQIRTLAKGVDVVVATPGRLLDHVQNGVLRLDKVNTVILDEADQMLDLGFVPTIRKIMARTPKERQTLLLSATMPKQIRRLANDFLTRPVEISVTPASKPIERIDQSVIFAEKVDKRRMLAGLLQPDDIERAIVFTRTKHGADKVTKDLVKTGLHAAAIHGNKSQNQRTKTLDGFKTGKINILVATDIAARGIDVDGVSHVINFELPNIPESYVHRIGRTARAGKSGVAVSFCDGEERAYLRDIEKLIGMSIHRKKIDGSDGTYAERLSESLIDTPQADDKTAEGQRSDQAKKRRRKRRPNKSGPSGGAGRHNAQGESLKSGGISTTKKAWHRGQKPGSASRRKSSNASHANRQASSSVG